MEHRFGAVRGFTPQTRGCDPKRALIGCQRFRYSPNDCATYGDSGCGCVGRSQGDTLPDTRRYQHSATAAGTRRTGSPTYWNRWHRMMGRLEGEKRQKLSQHSPSLTFPFIYMTLPTTGGRGRVRPANQSLFPVIDSD